MTQKTDSKVRGITAEFHDVPSLMAACRRVRDAGYVKTDAFAPFPIHGIDEALGIKPTVLPWIALAMGLTGTTIALTMQIWMNGIDYQYIISGKPFVSLPAFVPVTFELTILLASFGAFFGMWALNGLPRFSNPMFTNPRFDRATDDTFFLYVDAKDPRFDRSGVERLLADAGGKDLAAVVDDDTPTVIPRFLLIAIVTGIALSMIPLLVVIKMRVTTSELPRFHVFFDMDFSPAKDAQQTSTLFADYRAARPDVPGTVARGQYSADLDFQTGIDIDQLTRMDQPRAERLVTALAAQDEPTAEAAAAAEPAAEAAAGDAASPAPAAGDAAPAPDNTPWLKKNPLTLTQAVLERGQTQFNIYCATCHGVDGRGNGLVAQRAQKILSTNWNPPSNMHDPELYEDKYADGKLFSTISNGIRKMPGYGSQIKVEDRWAIVAYVRALQDSQNASLDDVAAGDRARIQAARDEAMRKLEEAAKAEQKRIQEAAAGEAPAATSDAQDAGATTPAI